MEIWKAIEGYEDSHEISNKGRVRSIDRIDCQGRRLKGNYLKPKVGKFGYHRTGLRKDGLQKFHLIHRLVAQAFLLNQDNKSQVNHIDGDKSNNSVENLEWVTPSENNHHAYDSGLKRAQKGEDNGASKLTKDQVIDIYIRIHKGEKSKLLSMEYGVDYNQILRIKSGKHWSWLTKQISLANC